MEANKTELSLALLISIIKTEAKISQPELVSGARYLLEHYDTQEILKSFDTVKTALSTGIDAICASIRTEFSEKEKIELVLNLFAVSFSGTMTHAEEALIRRVAAAVQCGKEHVESLMDIFSFDLENLERNEAVLTIGDATHPVDIPLPGCASRLAFFKHAENSVTLISLNGSGLYLNGRYRPRNFNVMNFGPTDSFYVEDHDFVIDWEYLEFLFENKRLNRSENIWLNPVNGEMTKVSKQSGESILKIEIWRNQYKIFPLAPDQVVVVSHQEYALPLKSAFFIGEKLQIKGIPGDLFIGKPAKCRSMTHLDSSEDHAVQRHPVPIKNLSAENLTARYPNKKKLSVIDISFSLNPGEMMAIMGPSSSGKSSLLRALIGSMVIEKGAFFVNGQACSDGILDIKEHIGYVQQEDSLDNSLSVYENLYYYQKLRSRCILSDTEIEARIDDVLLALNMPDKKDKMIVSRDSQLSGGTRKRLNMAMELIGNPDILILDEPTSGLSSYDSEQVISLLKPIFTTS